VLITDLATAGSTPVLNEVMRFSAARQRLLVHNIANMDTPDFRPADVSVTKFQRALADAVEKRRGGCGGGQVGRLERVESREIARDGNRMILKPQTNRGGVLYHDRNNRDVERLMQDLAENALVYRTASDLLRRQTDVLRVAISQRV